MAAGTLANRKRQLTLQVGSGARCSPWPVRLTPGLSLSSCSSSSHPGPPSLTALPNPACQAFSYGGPEAKLLGALNPLHEPLISRPFNKAVFYTVCQALCLGLSVQRWGAARLLGRQCINRPAKLGWQHCDRKARAV